MKFLVFYFIIVSTITFTYGQYRIINGNNAKEGQFPYQVFLQLKGRGNACGGSIIHKRWILTAAHCLEYTTVDHVKVGITNLKSRGIIYQAEKTIMHEQYYGGNYVVVNDIALIRLKSDLKFNEKISPIRLPKNNSITYENEIAIISGFGIVDFRIQEIFDHLQFAYVHILQYETCYAAWPITFTQAHICSSIEQKRSTCQGDSGGPVIIGKTQIGIISFVGPGCDYKLPNVHTRVSAFVPWIKEKLNQHNDALESH